MKNVQGVSFLLVVVLFLLPSVCLGEKSSLDIGSVDLSLGMPKDVALQKLRAHYSALPTISDNDYNVLAKEGFLGSVVFKEERVSYISVKRFDTVTDKGVYKLVDVLSRLLKEVGSSAAQIHARSEGSDKLKTTTIEIIHGNRRVVILQTEGIRAGVVPEISVFESIEATAQ